MEKCSRLNRSDCSGQKLDRWSGIGKAEIAVVINQPKNIDDAFHVQTSFELEGMLIFLYSLN